MQLDATDDPAATAVKTVVIIDDHQAFADLLALALGGEPDFDIVGTAATAGAGLTLVAETQPSMVVVDIHLGGQDGLVATRQIRALMPEVVIVVVSAHREANWVARAASAGANAFAPKSGSLTEILSILRRARIGSMAVAPSLFRQTVSPPPPADDPPTRLTDREQDVLNLMGRGIPPAQIARVLNISLHTCRGYVKTIHGKLGVRSQLEAVVKAQQLGLLEPRD